MTNEKSALNLSGSSYNPGRRRLRGNSIPGTFAIADTNTDTFANTIADPNADADTDTFANANAGQRIGGRCAYGYLMAF